MGEEPEGEQAGDAAAPELWAERAGDGAPAPARPTARRPVRQRPAPAKVTAAARGERPGGSAAPERPRPRGARTPTLPRAWWLAVCVEVTLMVLLLVTWLSGWGDPPAGCSRSLCSTGQGVGLLSLIGVILVGGVLVVGFMVVAVGAATRQPSQGRTPKTR